MSNMFEQCQQAFHRVFEAYAQTGCPCAYPRYRQLASFDFHAFGTGPVGCHLTEQAIGSAIAKGGMYESYPSIDRLSPLPSAYGYRCRVCGTIITYFDEEYSINMRFGRLDYGEVKAAEIGLPPADKIPMPRGFFGFNNEDIERCVAGFTTPGAFADLERYLTMQKEPPIRPARP
jgi:hypothetical protein